jgi:hypothetical protein
MRMTAHRAHYQFSARIRKIEDCTLTILPLGRDDNPGFSQRPLDREPAFVTSGCNARSVVGLLG